MNKLYAFVISCLTATFGFSQGFTDSIERSVTNVDSMIQYYDRLLNKENLPIAQKIDFSKKKITLLRDNNKISEAYEIGVKNLDKYCLGPLIDCEACSDLFRTMSDILFSIEDYNMAIKYLAMDCKKTDPVWSLKMAGLYLENNESAKAFQLISNSQSIFTEDESKITWLYGTGILESKQGKHDKAFLAYTKALELIESSQLRLDLKPTISGNIGELYLFKKDYTKAKELLTLDSEGSLKNGKLTYYVNAEILLGQIEITQGQYKLAADRLTNLINNFPRNLSFKARLQAVDMIIESFQNLKDEDRYLAALVKKSEMLEEKFLLDSKDYKNLIQNYSVNSVRTVQKKMDLDKKIQEREFELEQQKSEQIRIRNSIIITGLVLLLIIGYFLFRKYKSENQKKAQLKDSRLKLAEQEQEILSLKIKHEQRNVNELSLELGVKSDFASNLNMELVKFENVTSSQRKNLEIFIQTELEIKSVRAELQQTIENSEGQFISNLKILHANLTDNDIRLALMIVLKHTNKEIAIKKNITLESVKIAKNRLKKKLALSTKDDLFKYLTRILHDN